MRKMISKWPEVNAEDNCNLYTIRRIVPGELSHFAKEVAQNKINLHYKHQINEEALNFPKVLCWDIVKNFSDFLKTLNSHNSEVELRVQSHFTDSCKLFHGDNVFARMIITYCGPTTEVVEEDNLNRDQLGQDWDTFEEYNSRVVKNRSNVISLEPLYIHIHFGEKSGKLPQIHRAPDIEGTRQVRLTAIGTIY
jgi:hypothetical protein